MSCLWSLLHLLAICPPIVAPGLCLRAEEATSSTWACDPSARSGEIHSAREIASGYVRIPCFAFCCFGIDDWRLRPSVCLACPLCVRPFMRVCAVSAPEKVAALGRARVPRVLCASTPVPNPRQDFDYRAPPEGGGLRWN